MVCCVTAAIAETAPANAAAAVQSDRIAIGPIVLSQDVQGITVNTSDTMNFAVETKADGLHLSLVLDASFVDLQQKFAQIIGTLPLPRAKCKSFTLVNPVVSSTDCALKAEGDTAVIALSSDVYGWTYLENRVPETYWDSTGCRVTSRSVATTFLAAPRPGPGA